MIGIDSTSGGQGVITGSTDVPSMTGPLIHSVSLYIVSACAFKNRPYLMGMSEL